MKSNFNKMIFAIFIIFISSGIAYSQKLKVDISPESIDFGIGPIYANICVPVCITNEEEIDICIAWCCFLDDSGYSKDEIKQDDPYDKAFFSSLSTMHATLASVLKPNEKLEFYVIFFPKTKGPKNATLQLLAGPDTKQYPLVATDTIRINLSGNCTTDNEMSVGNQEEIPTDYSLLQNYPNPFNPTTKIEYSLPEASMVKLAVYNNLGQEVASLVNEYKAAGKYIADFNANNLPSGMYFYKLQSGNFNSMKKMMLIK